MSERATLDQLARGLHRAVTRADAKKIATLHGHKWKALLKRMKRIGRDLRQLEDRVDTELTQRAGGTVVPGSLLDAAARELRGKYSPEAIAARSGWASKVIEEMHRGA